MHTTKILGLSLGLTVISLSAQETYHWGNVRFDGGGFVSSVIPSQAMQDLIYIRTDVGGIYRWNAASENWIPLMDWVGQNDVGIYGTEALALDPNDVGKVYVLGGTSYFSDGKTVVFRSSDFGATWDTTDVTSQFKAHGNGMGRQTGEKLAVDPNNGSILFCGSRLNGLFKSSDGAKTWTLANALGATGSGSLVNDIGVSFVLFDPASPLLNGATSRLIVGVGKTASNLFISNDAGATFSEITGGPSQMPMRAVLNGDQLFITFSSGPGPHSVSSGSVWKYNLTSSQWTNITPKDGSALFGSGGQSYAHGFSGIAINPFNKNHMLLSTTNFYGGNQGTDIVNWSGPWGDMIFVSHDAGTTWTPVFRGKSKLDPNGTNWIQGHTIHWAGSIAFDPFYENKAWVVSGNGVFQSDDVSTDTQVWKFQSKGIEETVPLDAVSIPGKLVTAIGDYDGAVYSNITESPIQHNPTIGTTYSMAYAPLTGHLLRAGQVTDYSSGQGVNTLVMYHSKDVGKTWNLISNVKGLHGMLTLNADGSTFFHKAENSVSFWRSTDQGTNWTEVNGLGSQSQYAPLIADPIDPQKLYLLDNMGDFYASEDAGANFSKVGTVVDDAMGFYTASTMKMRAVPGKSGQLWIPLDQNQAWAPGGFSQNGLAFTDDGGKTFIRFNSVQTCIALGIGKGKDENTPYTLFMWGAPKDQPIGIYRSDDLAQTWVRINDDQHQFGGPGNGNFILGDQNIYGRVYMSTVGRGLIYGNLGGAPEGALAIRESNPFSQPLVKFHSEYFQVQLPSGNDFHLDFLNAKGKTLQTLYSLSGSVQIPVKDFGQGAVFLRIRNQNQQIYTLRLK